MENDLRLSIGEPQADEANVTLRHQDRVGVPITTRPTLPDDSELQRGEPRPREPRPTFTYRDYASVTVRRRKEEKQTRRGKPADCNNN